MVAYRIEWKAWRGYGRAEHPSITGTSTVKVHADADSRTARATAMTSLDEFLRKHHRRYAMSSATSRAFIGVEVE